VSVRVALAIGVAAFGAAGCAVDNASLDVPPQTGVTGALTPAPASGVPSSYTGLGSRTKAFARGHHEGSAGSTEGGTVSQVKTSGAGRVTGYVITFNYQPPLSDAQRLASAVAIADLPADRITIRSTSTCIVYASPTMKRLVGMLYTSVMTTPGSTSAQVRTTPTRTC
jgi:hypothetical protein